jgi:hypothetical protein
LPGRGFILHTDRLAVSDSTKTGCIKLKPLPKYMIHGLNIMDLWTETGIARIKFLRDAIYSDSEAGRLIQLSIKVTQVEAGIAEQILGSTSSYNFHLSLIPGHKPRALA